MLRAGVPGWSPRVVFRAWFLAWCSGRGSDGGSPVIFRPARQPRGRTNSSTSRKTWAGCSFATTVG